MADIMISVRFGGELVCGQISALDFWLSTRVLAGFQARGCAPPMPGQPPVRKHSRLWWATRLL